MLLFGVSTFFPGDSLLLELEATAASFDVPGAGRAAFSIDVSDKAGILTCKIEPGGKIDGDVELLIAPEYQPSREDYVCSSTISQSSREACSLVVVEYDVAYAVLFSNGGSVATGVVMKRELVTEDDATAVDVGVDMSSDQFDLEQGQYLLYSIGAPSETTERVSCSTGGNSALKLYMRAGRLPVPPHFDFDCLSEHDEQCYVHTSGGEVYVLVKGWATVRGGSISCEVALDPNQQEMDEDSAVLLEQGQETEFDMLLNQVLLFSLPLTPGAMGVTC